MVDNQRKIRGKGGGGSRKLKEVNKRITKGHWQKSVARILLEPSSEIPGDKKVQKRGYYSPGIQISCLMPQAFGPIDAVQVLIAIKR